MAYQTVIKPLTEAEAFDTEISALQADGWLLKGDLQIVYDSKSVATLVQVLIQKPREAAGPQEEALTTIEQVTELRKEKRKG